MIGCWVQAVEWIIMLFSPKYANELINIHEYAGNATQKYRAPEPFMYAVFGYENLKLSSHTKC